MSDGAKIAWGALVAVAVYLVGQLLSKFFIEPVHELRRSVGEVRFNLAFHAPTIHTPAGRTKESSEAARAALLGNSSDLVSKLHAVPAYKLVRFLAFGALPPAASIERAAVKLRGLATYMHEGGDQANDSISQINSRVESIMRLLCLRHLEGENDA